MAPAQSYSLVLTFGFVILSEESGSLREPDSQSKDPYNPGKALMK